MEIRPAEISEILKKQIAAFDTEANVAETGQVLSVGDGIARPIPLVVDRPTVLAALAAPDMGFGDGAGCPDRGGQPKAMDKRRRASKPRSLGNKSVLEDRRWVRQQRHRSNVLHLCRK